MNFNLIAYALDFVSFVLQELEEHTSKIKQVILFGSIVRGEANSESDIDLFFDVMDPTIEQKIREVHEKFYTSSKVTKYWRLLGIQNEFHCSVGKLEEWEELQRSLVAQGIILYGKYKEKGKTDPYYLFLVTPGKNRNKNVSVWRQLYGYTQKIGKKVYQHKGLVEEYDGKRLGKGVFIVPLERAQQVRSFLLKNKFKQELIPFWKEVS